MLDWHIWLSVRAWLTRDCLFDSIRWCNIGDISPQLFSFCSAKLNVLSLEETILFCRSSTALAWNVYHARSTLVYIFRGFPTKVSVIAQRTFPIKSRIPKSLLERVDISLSPRKGCNWIIFLVKIFRMVMQYHFGQKFKLFSRGN